MAARVSVITATYNQGAYLAEALDSALSQSGVDVEVIVVDDASTDNTTEVLKTYADRVRVIRLPENCGGPAGPRNIGFKAATGDYLAILDGDDRMLPGRLAEQVALLEAHPDISFVCANFRNFDSSSAADVGDELAGHPEFWKIPKDKIGERWYRLPRKETYETLIGDNFVGVATVMFRRSVLQDVGYFDESLKRSEDIEFWYRIARACTFGYIDAVMAGRRLHTSNISSSPAALEAKLEIYRRQKDVPMSAETRRMLCRMMGKIHFSLGYLDRKSGRSWSAIKRFFSSLCCDFNRGRAIISIGAVLLPWRGAATEEEEGKGASRRLTGFLLAGILVLASGLRLYRIGSRGLWQDEVDLWMGSLCGWRSQQIAPLSLWIHTAWLYLTGGFRSAAIFHLPSVAFGAFAVVPVYFLGRQMFGRRTGLLAALFTAISPMAIFYSQEARPYALFLNLITLTVFFFVRARAEGRLRWTLAYIVAAALSLMTHALTVFVLGGIVLWALIEDLWDRKPRRFLPVLLATSLSSVGAAWMLIRGTVGSAISTKWDAPFLDFVRVAVYALGPDISHIWEWKLWITVSAVALCVLALLGLVRLKIEKKGLLFALFPIIFALFLGSLYLTLGGKTGWKWDRYLTPLLPLFLVLIAGGCFSFSGQWRKIVSGLAALIFMTGVVTWAEHETYNRSEQQETIAHELSAHASELAGFIMVAPIELIYPTIAVYSFEPLRTDGLPTYLVDKPGLSFVPSAPVPPINWGRVAEPARALPPGRYLVYDWANWTGTVRKKMVQYGLKAGKELPYKSGASGVGLFVFATTTTVTVSSSK